MNPASTTAERDLVERLVDLYLEKQKFVRLFQKSIVEALNETPELKPFVHSVKWRLKDPNHLRDKLYRKINKCKELNQVFEISEENLLVSINDLAGIRILHLHTKQIAEIDKLLKILFLDAGNDLVEGPFARTWDDESRAFFNEIGIDTQASPTMYTSVHYVVASRSPTCVTCEIQVRTLMEEVWGEVDHTINYPDKIEDVACREQILALARATSSATRLVDSIFATVKDLEAKRTPATESVIKPASSRRQSKTSKKRRP